jgi:arsenate reductase-like glutaredoxin family protein
MQSEKFKVEIYDLGREYVVETYPEEEVSRKELKKWIKICKEMEMQLVNDAPYTFRATVKNIKEASLIKEELKRRIKEED